VRDEPQQTHAIHSLGFVPHPNLRAIKNAPPEKMHKGLSTRGVFTDRGEAKAFYDRMKSLKKTGGVYQFESFASSSVGETPAFSSKEMWLHINGKTGVDIHTISEYGKAEMEVLFGTEQRFKVKNYEVKDDKYHVWLEEL